MTSSADSPHDRPRADDLVEIVAEFLHDEVLDAVDGQLAFHVRVAINALAIADRELRLGAGHADAHAARLAEVGCGDDAELAERIRAGDFDDRYVDVAPVLRALVWDKLAVMNPKYVNPYTTPDARED
jgi:hypothetical protein